MENELRELARLLQQYGHYGQMEVAEDIAKSLSTPNPDYKRLTGVDMWGGSGAVWEVCLTLSESSEATADKKSFREIIIRIAYSMERLGIATRRSRDIAETFQMWVDKGY